MQFFRGTGRLMPGDVRIAVWDIPTRLFHWLLVGLFALSWWSAENREMEWHRSSGTLLMGLLIFRVIWGFVGGSSARFASFLRSPRALLRELRHDAGHTSRRGHTPLGGYSVAAMLLLLAIQVATGLFAVDLDGLESGPLSYLLDFDTSRTVAKVHGTAFNLLLALVALHIAAIAFYLLIRRRNLVMPMITGGAEGGDDGDEPLVRAPPSRLIAAATIAAAITWWIGAGAGG